MVGKITKIVSNTYFVITQDITYDCTARGKLKTEEIKPVVRRQCRI